MIEIRRLPADAITLVADIDRSEHITVHYVVVDGELRAEPVDWSVPSWNRSGRGEHSVAEIVDSLRPILARGGVLLGGFVDGSFAGLAVVETGFEPSLTWLAFLHVSRPFRRAGVASALWEETVALARSAGDEAIYVSATPSGSAVGFYRARGCVLADPPHPELLALEPEDVHFVCTVAVRERRSG